MVGGMAYLDKEKDPQFYLKVTAARDELTAILSDLDARGSFDVKELNSRLGRVDAWLREAGHDVAARTLADMNSFATGSASNGA